MATDKKASKSDQPKATYKVLGPLNHNNEPFAPGDEVQLTEAEAREIGKDVVAPVDAKT